MSAFRVILLCGGASLLFEADRPGPTTPAAQSLRQVATLRTARAAHTATGRSSGDILLVGGMTSTADSRG
jgi:hypothetical protein